MAKDPAFTWYAQDFIVDTIQWTRAMQGLHCYLLSVAWINRGLTVDATGTPTGLVPEDVEIWNRIKHKWKLSGSVLVNARQEETREKRKNFISSQSAKGKASADKRKKATRVEPFERENVNEVEKEKEFDNYIEWTNQILDRNCEPFQVQMMNEHIPESPNIDHWVRDHLGLLDRYPNMRPPNQQRFVGSVMKHVRENYKKNIQTNGAANKNIEHFRGLVKGFAERHGKKDHE